MSPHPERPSSLPYIFLGIFVLGLAASTIAAGASIYEWATPENVTGGLIPEKDAPIATVFSLAGAIISILGISLAQSSRLRG